MENFSSFLECLGRETIIFRYDDDETLWARFFDSDGDQVGCCIESSSNSNEDFYNNAEGAQVSSSDEKVDSEDNHQSCSFIK